MIQNRIPPKIIHTLRQLGEHIRIARKRRRITMAEMASRMCATRKTLSRLENGEPGVSLGVVAMALWVLGLENDLMPVADPEKDQVGIFKERQRLPKRVRTKQDNKNLDF